MAIDLVLVNALAQLFLWFGWNPESWSMCFLMNVFYLVSVLTFRPYAQNHFVRVDEIMGRVLQTVLLYYFLIGVFLKVDGIRTVTPMHFAIEFAITLVVLFYGRYGAREWLNYRRQIGRNVQTAVFVGAGHNLAYLYEIMMSELKTGYRVYGYFDEQDSTILPAKVKRLGNIEEVYSWLHDNKVDQLYCNLPSSRSAEIVKLINYCENHLIRFFSVPNVRNYVHRQMVVEMMDNMPVLTLRKEPLSRFRNRAVKRAFDVAVSGLFLLTCFWWIAIVVALITKITMPGPVFFKQKRNGLLGEEFYCLKFRSMCVNQDADNKQATQDDPRTTAWGRIMRKTNIDELPQFINVFMGSMSIVGPRPHMVKHTEEYSALVDKYMVRHWVKPGITGWAQVKGARGETHELWQMEKRIRKDVWYVENWSLWLDIRIIYLTIRNTIQGDKQAY